MNLGSPAPEPIKTAWKPSSIHQLVDCDRFADNYVRLNLTPSFFSVVDLRLYNGLLRKTELRNTVCKNSARLMKGLENGHVVAQV